MSFIFFKEIFSRGYKNNNENINRVSPTHPDDLEIGDIIKFAFTDNDELSNQRCEVIAINSYDFGGELGSSFTIKSDKGQTYFLAVAGEDGEDYIAISKKLKRSEVNQLFDDTEFSSVFDEGATAKLTRKSDYPAELEKWTAPSYYESEDCVRGYYHKGDYRQEGLPKYEDSGEQLDYYLLEDDDESFAIEIEVYGNGETEVCVAIYLDLSDIEEYWPAGHGNIKID